MIFEVIATRIFTSPHESVALPIFRVSSEGEAETNIQVASILRPTSEFKYEWYITEI